MMLEIKNPFHATVIRVRPKRAEYGPTGGLYVSLSEGQTARIERTLCSVRDCKCDLFTHRSYTLNGEAVRPLFEVT